METKAKYHLYETAHSGIIPGQTVNLVPTTWTNRTVTDGEWMTSKTLSALNLRDYFLANMIDTVDEDKKNHYIGIDGIVIDHENRTISYSPDYKYEFVNESAMWIEPHSNYIYTKLNENTNNKIKLKNSYINYDLTAKGKDIPTTPTINPNTTATATGFSGGDITTFPSNTNVVFVSKEEFYINNITSMSAGASKTEAYKNIASGTQWVVTGEQKYEGYRKNWNASTENPTVYTEGNSSKSSTNVFDPTNRTNYAGGYAGGPNFISGSVDMVPSGVLFVW